jgi:hypothetical protein
MRKVGDDNGTGSKQDTPSGFSFLASCDRRRRTYKAQSKESYYPDWKSHDGTVVIATGYGQFASMHFIMAFTNFRSANRVSHQKRNETIAKYLSTKSEETI